MLRTSACWRATCLCSWTEPSDVRVLLLSSGSFESWLPHNIPCGRIRSYFPSVSHQVKPEGRSTWLHSTMTGCIPSRPPVAVGPRDCQGGSPGGRPGPRPRGARHNLLVHNDLPRRLTRVAFPSGGHRPGRWLAPTARLANLSMQAQGFRGQAAEQARHAQRCWADRADREPEPALIALHAEREEGNAPHKLTAPCGRLRIRSAPRRA
jgi:hypothetical protein